MSTKTNIFISVSVAILALLPLRAKASERVDSLSLKIYFRQDVSRLELDYRNNQEALNRFVNGVREIMTDPCCKIQDIYIRSSASPEGQFQHNKELSQNRGYVLKKYLQDNLNLPDEKLRIDAVGEDWAGLRRIVLNNDIPDKEKILEILDRHSDFVNGRPTSYLGSPKPDLQNLNGGRTWFWLLENVYPDLRSAGNNIVCRFVRDVEPEQPKGRVVDTVVVIHKYIVDPNGTAPGVNAGQPPVAAAPAAAPTEYYDTRAERPRREHHGPRYQFAVKTNLLVDAAISPNIELEFPIGKRVSILANHNFPWFVFDNDRYALELLNTGGEVRYWFGDREKHPVLSGAYVGLYGAALKSDLEYKSVGNQVPYTWQAGVSGGWSFPLGKRQNWRFDLGMSLGYIPYTYYHYERSEVTGLLMYKYTDTGTWIGPTNVRCSIAWMFPPHKRVQDRSSTAADITKQDRKTVKQKKNNRYGK